MEKAIFLVVALMFLTAVSAAPFLVAPVGAASGALRKSVYVSVGGAGAACCGGGMATPVMPVTKPVAVPVEVPVETERPAAVTTVLNKPVYQPVYFQPKPVAVVGDGSGGGGVFTSSVHVDSSNLFNSIFNIPISVLRAVNQFLNNSFRGGATVHVNAVKGYYGGMAAGGAGSSSSSSSSSSSYSSSSSSSAASSNDVFK